MKHEINMKLENAMQLIDEAMEIWPYSIARFIGEETVECVFVDTSVEMQEVAYWMKQKRGVVTTWAKPN
jgi:hypothetical protein